MAEGIKQLDDAFGMKAKDLHTYSPLTLAYLGDVVYELIIRNMLVKKGNCPVNKLHRAAIGYVKAGAQARIMDRIEPLLTEEETAIYRRGRNSKSATMPKHAGVMEYRRATGLESVFGYLYLTGQTQRLRELIRVALGAEEHQEKGTDEHE